MTIQFNTITYKAKVTLLVLLLPTLLLSCEPLIALQSKPFLFLLKTCNKFKLAIRDADSLRSYKNQTFCSNCFEIYSKQKVGTSRLGFASIANGSWYCLEQRIVARCCIQSATAATIVTSSAAEV